MFDIGTDLTSYAMLTFFLQPIPDETLYSVMVRNFLRSGYRIWLDYIKGIFHERRVEPRALLPAELGAIAPYLNSNGVGEIAAAERLTVFPYFRPFLSEHGSERLFELRASDHAKMNSVYCVGINSARVKWEATLLRFCSECRKEQLDAYGHTAWLRSHQLPGVNTCWKHEYPLIEVDIPRENTVLPAHIKAFRQPHGNATLDDFWLANASTDLLHACAARLPGANRRLVYRQAAEKMGFGPVRHLDRTALINAVHSVWGKRTLKRLGLSLSENVHRSWLTPVLATQERSLSPLIHILMIRVLFNDVTDFLESAANAHLMRYADPVTPRRDLNDIKVLEKRPVIRGILHKYIAECSTPSIQDFRSKNPNAYKWLYFYDKPWMDDRFDQAGARRYAGSGQYRKKA